MSHSNGLHSSMDSDRSPLLKNKSKRLSADSFGSINSSQSSQPMDFDFRSKVKLDPAVARVDFFHRNRTSLFYFCGLFGAIIVLFSLLTVGAIVMPGQFRENSGDIVHTRVMWKQKGIAFSDGRYCPWVKFGSTKSLLSLQNLMSTGATHVGLIVVFYQDYFDSTTMYATNTTATKNELRHITTMVKSLGAKVMLMPQIELMKDTSHTRADIGSTFNDSQWKIWFAEYYRMINEYANLAGEQSIDIFSVGCELNATSSQDQSWRVLISNVKATLQAIGDPNFMSNVTYQSQSGGEETSKTWWDELDYIGINPKYDMEGNTLDSLVHHWKTIQDHGVGGMSMGLRNLSEKFNKSILFTEVEYCSGNCHSSGDIKIDLGSQTLRYQALFTSFKNTPWFEGIYYSKWLTDPAFGGQYNVCPSPQFKPSEETLRAWYGGKSNSTVPPYPPECPCIM
eukprot:TRINITY_DN7050_c0_g1_i1.p1 TRINITY_DN7050_c0_g1~~TRINITY_DN7050_c0_g1_i1.p1  ORF type:complete len:452 (+),score=115.02 TRINITY_DN7050_c0_g1_i1:51-1406(+)